MKRLIVDFKKLTEEILQLLVARYPNGYEDKDVITFKNAQNELIEAVEVRTEDTIYLVKVSKRLENTMQDYEDNMEDDNYNDDMVTSESDDMYEEREDF